MGELGLADSPSNPTLISAQLSAISPDAQGHINVYLSFLVPDADLKFVALHNMTGPAKALSAPGLHPIGTLDQCHRLLLRSNMSGPCISWPKPTHVAQCSLLCVTYSLTIGMIVGRSGECVAQVPLECTPPTKRSSGQHYSQCPLRALHSSQKANRGREVQSNLVLETRLQAGNGRQALQGARRQATKNCCLVQEPNQPASRQEPGPSLGSALIWIQRHTHLLVPGSLQLVQCIARICGCVWRVDIFLPQPNVPCSIRYIMANF